MSYEVVNEKLKLEACNIEDLTSDQVETFLKLWNDGASINTLVLFAKKDMTVVLNKDHPKYDYYKGFTEDYLQYGEKYKLPKVPEGMKEVVNGLDRIMAKRKCAEVFSILGYCTLNCEAAEMIQKIFNKYDGGVISLLQIFNYGLIEGKRMERARRKKSVIARYEVKM